MNSLIISIFTGAIGVGYFMYGKRQAKMVAMLAGLTLCIYPYFFDNLIWLILIGAALAAAPFLFDY